ncbi:hypothetical protein Drose_35015 [Dactylosporangium roseum]|uniref:Uncharacterized protein n=1 Tax=Dactylosporangium roseum TaxID=47989 RepID=A0ABY5Z3R8_9ACTN|nr:hypothetical protein [Dactylosporangium roseum]UWZ36211.1 hypothetical protein Drose_35015 [Dactylosporangium roseum]
MEVAASLWRSNGGRDFVQLMVTPVPDDALRRELAGILAGVVAPERADGVAGPGNGGSPVVYQHHDDPELIIESHPHDLTLDQAEVLHRALGRLLGQARNAIQMAGNAAQ